MIVPFVLPLLALRLVHIVKSCLASWPRAAKGTAVLAALVDAAGGIASVQQWAIATRAGIDRIDGTHVKMGRWIAANLPADAVVAVFDIGGIGYFSRRRIVDLGGLTDPAFVPHLYDHTVRRYLEDHRIDWLVRPIDPERTKPPETDSSSCSACRTPTVFTRRKPWRSKATVGRG